MTREEKANELAQKYFPDANNIWARANLEAEFVKYACLEMASWVEQNLWKSADGDYLPEIDREVVVFTQTERQYPKVAIAHTMPMGDWKQFDGNRYYLERNGEVGWSLPDVKIWLDAPLPFKEDEV